MADLYIVATPIGNLEDITLRALRVLKEVDVILCEDTRHTKILLEKYSINQPMMSYHHHSKLEKMQEIADLLKMNKKLALVSDAGTPGISDPGNLLIRYLLDENINVNIIPIPGPSGLAAGLSVSGFATDKFEFLGFVPHKKGRKTFFENLKGEDKTVIFYESPHRIEKTLQSLLVNVPDRDIVICRELTKMYETIYRGKPEEVIKKIAPGEIKGEFIVIVS
ncbi:MAG: 16S rRNA (cytidine(1402)-2'-O)-methyltransferase [Candidatus Paceibacterota bacterium]|jgi:16S rRNA (cytidine1402-2'-O)-methyltransferase